MPGFLGDLMIVDIFTTHFSTLMKGLAFTFELAVVSMLCGSLLGIFLALGRTFGAKPVSWLCAAYIELIRERPSLRSFLYFILPFRPTGSGFLP